MPVMTSKSSFKHLYGIPLILCSAGLYLNSKLSPATVFIQSFYMVSLFSPLCSSICNYTLKFLTYLLFLLFLPIQLRLLKFSLLVILLFNFKYVLFDISTKANYSSCTNLCLLHSEHPSISEFITFSIPTEWCTLWKYTRIVCIGTRVLRRQACNILVLINKKTIYRSGFSMEQ